MYYWSRWANITTEAEAGSERISRPSWQETGYRQAVRRDTRPVVVVTRTTRNTQPLSTSAASQRNRSRVRETSPRISLDVRRSRTTSTQPLRPAGWQAETTTEDR
jgi:hypothetical protein